jgi:hypothetical protein
LAAPDSPYDYRATPDATAAAETLELLRGLEVNYAQGYHLGRPAELEL